MAPLKTESSAMPDPVAPPPITNTSYTSPLRSLASCSVLLWEREREREIEREGEGEGEGKKNGIAHMNHFLIGRDKLATQGRSHQQAVCPSMHVHVHVYVYITLKSCLYYQQSYDMCIHKCIKTQYTECLHVHV